MGDGDRKQGMGIGNRKIVDKDGDGWNQSLDGNVGCGFYNSLDIYDKVYKSIGPKF